MVEESFDPASFWMERARAIDWDRFPRIAHDGDTDRWFPDGRLNICYNAIDRHVEAGRGDRVALIYESPITGGRATFTFAEVQDRVARTAGMLADAGVGVGDRVLIYMPMVPEAAFAMLACARLGAIHCVVFGGFAAPELAKRIDDCEPVLILSASCGFEPGRTIEYKPLLDAALSLSRHAPRAAIILQRNQLIVDLIAGRDRDWAESYALASPVDCVPVGANDPLYILHTSGTTGTPKGVVRDHGSYAVALNWSMSAIYGVEPGEVFWGASDIGWVVGHSYIVYGPLIAGCASLMFEGKPVRTPDAGTFWRLIEEHRVASMFSAPTAIRAIRRDDPDGALLAQHDLSSLKALFLAGERSDPDTLGWISRRLPCPVIDHWWQTELGWPAIAICMGLPGDHEIRVGTAGKAVPGFRFSVVDDAGEKVAPGKVGNLLIATPLPPGVFRELWKNPARYKASFADFPGFYSTGDAASIDVDGYVQIMGRTDDVINVAGHRLSTTQMEEVVAGHPAVVESAAVGVDDELKGTVPVVFTVLHPGTAHLDAVASDIKGKIRSEIGSIATARDVIIIEALPKTRSGKILRSLLRDILNGREITIPQTIEDPSSVEHIIAAIEGRPGNSGPKDSEAAVFSHARGDSDA